MSNDLQTCPQCGSPYGYLLNDNTWQCPECDHQWNAAETEDTAAEDDLRVLDANGQELQNGDTVMIVKDLPVKGAPKPLKAGTKVKNIRLTDGDHNISCRIEGFGQMALKSEFVRKVS